MKRKCRGLFSLFLAFAAVIALLPFTGISAKADSVWHIAPNYVSAGYSISGSYAYVTTAASQAEIVGYAESLSGSITIPANVGGNTVKTLAPSLFNGNASITSVYIPDAVVYIASNCFEDCTALETVHLPASLQRIFDSAFDGCTSLKSITIPASCTEIRTRAFLDCKSLAEISFTSPSSLVDMSGSYIFCNTAVKNVSLPSTLQSLGAGAFKDCKNLESIAFPEQIYDIPDNCCNGCKSLKQVNFGTKTTNIFAYAFCGCTSLANLSLPSSLRMVGNYAFSGLAGLESMDIPIFDSPEPNGPFQPLALQSTSGFTVYGVSGSWAETWTAANAEKYGITFAVQRTPAILTQPSDVCAAVGDTVTFSVSAAGGGLHYQWYYKSTAPHLISGATFPSYTISSLTASDIERTYYCVVSNSSGSVTSGIASISGPSSAPFITQIPEILTANYGEKVTLYVSASCTGSLSYQWMFLNSNTGEYSNIPRATNPMLPLATSKPGEHSYRVVVTNSDTNESTTSSAIRVITLPAAPKAVYNNLSEITMTQDGMARLSAYPEFSAEGLGYTITYQWFYSNEDGSTGVQAVDSATDPDLIIGEGLKAGNTYRFFCTITNTYTYGFSSVSSNSNSESMETVLVTIKDAVCPFTDVASDQYYYRPVIWAIDQCVTSGTSPTTFSPNDYCTRAQAATFLWNKAGQPDPSSTSCPFTDVPSGAWYSKAVIWAYEEGITSGTTPTTFSPGDTVTRAQFVTFLWNYNGKPDPSEGAVNVFTDVSESAWYYTPVLWAYEHHVTSGTTAATFSPGDTVTRGQIVTFLRNYFLWF